MNNPALPPRTVLLYYRPLTMATHCIDLARQALREIIGDPEAPTPRALATSIESVLRDLRRAVALLTLVNPPGPPQRTPKKTEC